MRKNGVLLIANILTEGYVSGLGKALSIPAAQQGEGSWESLCELQKAK